MALTALRAMALAVQTPTLKGQGVPVMGWGSTGMAKTSLIEKLAEKLDAAFFAFNLQTKIPEHLGGFAIPDLERGVVQLMPPAVVETIRATKGLAILFIDEANTAERAMQAAELQLISERKMGDIQLPPNVAFLASSNPVEEAANGQELSAAFANRWVHIQWDLDYATWRKALLSDFEDGVDIPSFPKERWAMKWPVARGLVVGYLDRQPQDFDKKRENERELAWPNARKWDWAARLLAACMAAGAEDLKLPLIYGCVGEGVGNQFLHYMREADLPDPEELLDHPGRFKPTKHADLVYAVLGSVVAAVRAHLTRERYKAAWAIIRCCVKAGLPDVAAISAQDLWAMYKENLAKPDSKVRLDLPTEGLESLIPMMVEAGVVRRKKDAAA